jgi:hypothetical protein
MVALPRNVSRCAGVRSRGKHDVSIRVGIFLPGVPVPWVPSYPVVLGDIAPTSSASAAFTIDFGHCPTNAQFTLRVPWNSARYETGTLVLEHQRP